MRVRCERKDSTLMHGAASHNAVNALKWLNDNRYDIQARDCNGNTPMHYAAASCSLNALKWFEAQGVDLDVQNVDGKTPLSVSMEMVARVDTPIGRRARAAVTKWLTENSHENDATPVSIAA